MPLLDVTVYYLEMNTPVRRALPAPRSGLTILHAKAPSVAYYRFLYNAVGKDYHWRSRAIMPDAELAALLRDPLVEVHVLHVDGCPAGFAEIDRRNSDDVELVQFGLVREHIGQGLGKYFLQQIIHHIFGAGARRFWLHTCTLDHPNAMPNYQKAGFVLYKQELIQREIAN